MDSINRQIDSVFSWFRQDDRCLPTTMILSTKLQENSMDQEDYQQLENQISWKTKIIHAVDDLGDWSLFSMRTISWAFTSRPYPRTLLDSLYKIGVLTAPVVLLTGVFIGMVLSIQSYSEYSQFNLESGIGKMVNYSLIRELGPVLVATMLAGRVGSSMAAELATMRTTEQVDALESLGVNPIHYLVAPRFLASLLLVPMLTILAAFGGMMGGAFITINLLGVESHHYWQHTRNTIGLWDLLHGMIKPIFFGAAIALISCHRGLRNRKSGAEGVGYAATQAFVLSFVVILIIDFFLTVLLTTLEQI